MRPESEFDLAVCHRWRLLQVSRVPVLRKQLVNTHRAGPVKKSSSAECRKTYRESMIKFERET